MKTVWIVQSCRPSTEGDILCNIRAFSDLDSARAFKVEMNNKYSLFYYDIEALDLQEEV